MITENENGLYVVFGRGTVSVGSTIKDKEAQFLLFEELKDKADIGSKVERATKVADGKKIYLVFESPESVDVVISALKEIKENLSPLIRKIPIQDHAMEFPEPGMRE